METIRGVPVAFSFHHAFIRTLKTTPSPYLNSIVQYILSLMPMGRIDDKPGLGYENFLKKCSGGQPHDSKFGESVVWIVYYLYFSTFQKKKKFFPFDIREFYFHLDC